MPSIGAFEANGGQTFQQVNEKGVRNCADADGRRLGVNVVLVRVIGKEQESVK